MYGIVVVILISSLIALSVPIALYLLQAFGLFKMLKVCGFKKPWFAFVPVLNVFAIGSLSEVYNDGKVPKKHGKTLLIIYIVYLAIAIAYLAGTMVVAYDALTEFLPEIEERFDTAETITPEELEDLVEEFEELVAKESLALSVLSYFNSMFSVLYTVFLYIAIYKIYRIFSPNSALAFAILGAFFSFLTPILIFAFRNNPPQNLRWQQSSYDYPYPEL